MVGGSKIARASRVIDGKSVSTWVSVVMYRIYPKLSTIPVSPKQTEFRMHTCFCGVSGSGRERREIARKTNPLSVARCVDRLGVDRRLRSVPVLKL